LSQNSPFPKIKYAHTINLPKITAIQDMKGWGYRNLIKSTKISALDEEKPPFHQISPRSQLQGRKRRNDKQQKAKRRRKRNPPGS